MIQEFWNLSQPECNNGTDNQVEFLISTHKSHVKYSLMNSTVKFEIWFQLALGFRYWFFIEISLICIFDNHPQSFKFRSKPCSWSHSDTLSTHRKVSQYDQQWVIDHGIRANQNNISRNTFYLCKKIRRMCNFDVLNFHTWHDNLAFVSEWSIFKYIVHHREI